MVSNASAVMLEPEAISERATDILRNVFHHFAFRQGQLEAITSAVLGRDVVVRMTTGQGKSSLLPRPFLGPGCSAARKGLVLYLPFHTSNPSYYDVGEPLLYTPQSAFFQ